MTTDSTAVAAPTVIPHGYPLWAVRAMSGPGAGDGAGIGLVIGWEPVPDSSVLTPVVAEVAEPGLADLTDPWLTGGRAVSWTSEVVRDPDLGYCERVEVYPTREEAAGRVRSLMGEVRARWAALSASQAPHGRPADAPAVDA